MNDCWFSVGYKVEHGSKTELWDMILAAPDADTAKKMVRVELKGYHPKAKVTIQHAKTVTEDELYDMVN